MDWKKADVHEWAGDSFNRDSIVCGYTSAGISASNAISADNVYKLNADGNFYVTKEFCDTRLNAIDSCFTIRDDFDSLSNNVVQLAASLQELKDAFEEMKKETMPCVSKLRRALKTLNYKYEVIAD